MRSSSGLEFVYCQSRPDTADAWIQDRHSHIDDGYMVVAPDLSQLEHISIACDYAELMFDLEDDGYAVRVLRVWVGNVARDIIGESDLIPIFKVKDVRSV